MKFAFPILTAKGEEFKDVKELTALINREESGHYLLGNHNKWHGGIHISDQSARWCKDQYPIRAIADGKVVAFRMMRDYLTSEFQKETLRYSNCFCLVQHEYCEVNSETKEKNEFTFYSLYMHLLPWNQYQSTEKLVLKKGWNARNSVPHVNPNVEQQRIDAALPCITLPKDTELEIDRSTPSQKGSVGGKEYDFIKVIIKSQLSSAQIKAGEKAGVLVNEGCSVWIANSSDAVTFIKPNLPNWLFDQIDAELLNNMTGRADPVFDDKNRRFIVGNKSVSLPAGTKLHYDAHKLEFHWLGDKARKMARCEYVIPSSDSASASCGVAWVCVEDEFIKVEARTPSHLGKLYVVPSPVAIAAGEAVGYLGLVETPLSLMGGKKSKHQVHLEVFTQDSRLDDVLANKAGTKGGATYAKVPANLILYEKKRAEGKYKWVTTKGKSQEELVESPKWEKDAENQEWLCVSEGGYVKKDQIELLSQHDWLKIGFKKVDGSGSDGYLDPDAPPTFFTNLVKSFDTDKNGELSSEEIQSVLKDSSNVEQLHKLIVKHSSEWYEKSKSDFYAWLDKRMIIVGLPRFDALVDHEKERIDNLEWMQSADRLKLEKEVWHISPLGIMELIVEFILGDEMDKRWLTVPKGQLTFDAEGNDIDGNNWFSRIIHWPGGNSGVTIGRGYDLGQQSNPASDLNKVGIDNELKSWLINGKGRVGIQAREYYASASNGIKKIEISRRQQYDLFNLAYSYLEKDVQRICQKSSTIRNYHLNPNTTPEAAWDGIPAKIKEILVDLRYRGDYTPNVRKVIQASAFNGDVEKFGHFLSDHNLWPNVPDERFKIRISYYEN